MAIQFISIHVGNRDTGIGTQVTRVGYKLTPPSPIEQILVHTPHRGNLHICHPYTYSTCILGLTSYSPNCWVCFHSYSMENNFSLGPLWHEDMNVDSSQSVGDIDMETITPKNNIIMLRCNWLSEELRSSKSLIETLRKPMRNNYLGFNAQGLWKFKIHYWIHVRSIYLWSIVAPCRYWWSLPMPCSSIL